MAPQAGILESPGLPPRRGRSNALARSARLFVPLCLCVNPIFLPSAQAAETRLTAQLTPTHAATVQGKAGAGQPGASGSFAARVDPATGELCHALSLSGVPDVTMAHIHTLAAAPDGPALVALVDYGAEPGPGETCQPIGRTLAEQIATRPGEFYVNVHSEAHPGGAVSGVVGKS